MKTTKFTFILILAIISFVPVSETKAQSVSVNFNTFHQELSLYGRWMNNPRFGQVWIYNDADFKPYYSDGHWEYTNYGWSWISDYDWGWAPFHYGRWEYDSYYGWMWIPGYEWASAWVSWSSYDDYYGWAPLGYGININVSFASIPYDRWNFIPRRNICDRDLNRYYVPYNRDNNFRNAVVINNYYNGNGGVGRYVTGPERREVERFTNNRVEERRVDYNDRNWSSGNTVRNNNYNGNGRRNNDDNNGNNRRRNDVNSNGNPATPSDQPNRRPQRDANTVPQTDENNSPGGRQNDNKWNRSNDQQNNNPQRQQPTERPVPSPSQKPQAERPMPQQSPPVMEQRKLERRADNNDNKNVQRPDDNGRRENGNNGRRKNGN